MGADREGQPPWEGAGSRTCSVGARPDTHQLHGLWHELPFPGEETRLDWGWGCGGGVGRMGGGCLRPMRPELRPLLIPPQGHSADPEYPPFMELSLHVLALFFVSAFFFLILVLFFFF